MSREEGWRADHAVTSPLSVPPQGPVTGSSLPFWGLMAFTFVLLLAPQTFVPVLATLRIALVIGAATIAAHLLDRFIRPQQVARHRREMRIAACLAGWAIVTVPFSFWPGGSVAFLIDVYFKTLAVFWLLANTVTTLRRFRQVAWALTLMAIPIAVTAVRNFASGMFMPQAAETSRIAGYGASLTGNPNELALLLNLILPISFGLFLMSRKILTRTLLLAVVVADVLAVVLTFSRAGFMTLATIALMYLWKLRRRAEERWVLTAVLVGLL